MPGTRSAIDQRHVSEGDRPRSHGVPKFRGERGDYLVDREKSTKTTQLVSDLHADSAFGGRRFIGHGVLYRRRSYVELQRSVDMGKLGV